MSGLEFVNKVRGAQLKEIPILTVPHEVLKDVIEAIKAGTIS